MIKRRKKDRLPRTYEVKETKPYLVREPWGFIWWVDTSLDSAREWAKYLAKEHRQSIGIYKKKTNRKRKENIFELHEIVVYRRGGKLVIRKAKLKKKRKR